MAKHTIKGYIVWEKWNDEKEGKFVFQRYQAVKYGQSYMQTPICAHELTFDDGGFDPRPVELAALDEQEKKLRAAFAATLMEIGKRRSELLAITCEAAS